MRKNARHTVLIVGIWLCAQFLAVHHLGLHHHDTDPACAICHVSADHKSALAVDDTAGVIPSYRFDPIDRPIDVPRSINPIRSRARAPPV